MPESHTQQQVRLHAERRREDALAHPAVQEALAAERARADRAEAAMREVRAALLRFGAEESGFDYAALKLLDLIPDASPCTIPPPGWRCTRAAGHEGPCAAVPVVTPPPADGASLTGPLAGAQLTRDCPRPLAVQVSTRQLGEVLICAVRYALGRDTWVAAQVLDARPDCPACDGTRSVCVSSPGIDEWTECWDCYDRQERADEIRALPLPEVGS